MWERARIGKEGRHGPKLSDTPGIGITEGDETHHVAEAVSEGTMERIPDRTTEASLWTQEAWVICVQ